MKQRIFFNLLGLSLFTVIIMATLLSFIFYGFFSADKSAELKQNAFAWAQVLNLQQDKAAFLQVMETSFDAHRLTLIAANGQVIYDSYKEAQSLENHADRPEILAARQTGQGEDKRFSDTLGEETAYYAVRLDDGEIMRLARTSNSIKSLFHTLLPWLLLCSLLAGLVAFLLSRRLTGKIVAPINNLKLDAANNDVYEELYPLLDRIVKQKEQIKLQMAELEKRATTIQTIIKDMHEGIILLDHTEKILAINDSAASLFSQNAQAFTGREIIELTRDPVFNAHVQTALSGQACSQLFTKEQSTLEIYFDPVREGSKITGLVILFLDVTSKKAAERLRREFSANVSHELKTPLTTILGYAEMIANGMVKQTDVSLFAGKIHSQALNLISMIENIIKISQLDEKIDQQNLTSFDLRQVSQQVLDNLSAAADAAQIKLLPLAGEAECRVLGNKIMLQELLTNLLDNAIKYNQPGGQVAVSITQAAANICLCVEDSGIGIPSDQLERVFERFYRIDPSRSKQTGGSGLGLSIVKHIAEYHGGRVAVESELGAGTTVTVTLPILPSH